MSAGGTPTIIANGPARFMGAGSSHLNAPIHSRDTLAVSIVAELFELASAHHRSGDLARAEMLYNQVLRAEPSHVEALYNLGFLLHQQGKPDLAAFCYQNALRVKPDHVDAQNNLGVATMELGRFEEAAACLRQVLQLQPDHVDAQNNLGMAFVEQGLFDQAEVSLSAIARTPARPRRRPEWARRDFGQTGQIPRSAGLVLSALRQDAGHAETHLNRALLWLLQGNWAAGLPEYEWRWQTRTFPCQHFRQPRWTARLPRWSAARSCSWRSKAWAIRCSPSASCHYFSSSAAG